MFIELKEYDEYGDVTGNCIINSDNIISIDSYDSDSRTYTLRTKNDITYNIKSKEYNKLKDILVKEDLKDVGL